MVYGCRPLSRKTVSHPESVLQKNYKSDRDDQRLENIKEDGKKWNKSLSANQLWLQHTNICPLFCRHQQVQVLKRDVKDNRWSGFASFTRKFFPKAWDSITWQILIRNINNSKSTLQWNCVGWPPETVASFPG